MGDSILDTIINKGNNLKNMVISESSIVDKSLNTSNLGNDLRKDTIRNYVVNEVDNIEVPSYLIDISNIEMIKLELEALKGLVGGGDIAVYLKLSSGSIQLIGRGVESELYLVLNELLQTLHGDKCLLYKNIGGGFKRVSRYDIGSIRLDL